MTIRALSYDFNTVVRLMGYESRIWDQAIHTLHWLIIANLLIIWSLHPSLRLKGASLALSIREIWCFEILLWCSIKLWVVFKSCSSCLFQKAFLLTWLSSFYVCLYKCFLFPFLLEYWHIYLHVEYETERQNFSKKVKIENEYSILCILIFACSVLKVFDTCGAVCVYYLPIVTYRTHHKRDSLGQIDQQYSRRGGIISIELFVHKSPLVLGLDW